jgi:hypothetical protein
MKSSCFTDIEGITHCAFSDESGYNFGRYRSIAMVSFPHRNLDSIDEQIFAILQAANVREFKWMKLNDAKMRFCAIALVNLVIDQILQGEFRVDTLTWDIEDSRHNVIGRDDQENFRRMYYQIFKNVFRQRWDGPCIWHMFPDEHGSVDWENLHEFIERELDKLRNELSTPDDEAGLKNLVGLERIRAVQSSQCYPVQICDLFAGMATYSLANYSKFYEWQFISSGQTRFFQSEPPVCLTNRDKERCKVLNHFNRLCKDHRLGVSLGTKRGLWTPNPNNPLNFWLWIPQSDMDKAPVKTR